MTPSSAHPTLRDWLTRQPFTLAMSSGFFGFFAHAGVLCTLEAENLLPARVAGSSAGALVTGLWAAGLSGAELAARLRALKRADFWDPALGPGLLRGRRFRELLQSLLPVSTFAECKVPAAVSVFDAVARRTKVFTDGELAPAIQASCTVPLLFQPVIHQGRPLFDGGLLDRPGLAALSPGERVFHHHLSSRSPWRSHSSVTPPVRPNLVSFVARGLPRSGPFRLEAGRRAFESARTATRTALDLHVDDSGLLQIEVTSCD